MGSDSPVSAVIVSGTIFYTILLNFYMQNWLRGLLAGAGAAKWGGGCVGTILLFLLFYWLLGYC